MKYVHQKAVLNRLKTARGHLDAVIRMVEDGWPLVSDQDEETAIRALDGTGPIIAWGGPPVAPKLG